MSQPTYRLRALILRRTKLGESDLILTMLAEDGSLAKAVAKGARKPKSSFAARTEPLCAVDLLCARGRSLDIVKEARVAAAHDRLRRTVESSTAAMPVLELLGRVAQPALENPRLFQATDRALRAMDAADEAHVLAVAAASLLKTLAFSGLRPSLEVCVSCGEPVALEDGCPACRPSLETESVDAATLCWAQYFIASTFDAIAAGPADVSASFAVLHLVQSLVRAHVGAPLKSLEFLFTSGLF